MAKATKRKAGGGQVIVLGIPQLDKKLKKLPATVQKKVIRQAIRKSLGPVKKAVESNAPRDSGDLARSVKIKAMKRSRKKFGVLVQIGEGNFKGETYYAAMVEYGTRFQPAQGYMRRSFDETADAARRTAIIEIGQGILRLAEKS